MDTNTRPLAVSQQQGVADNEQRIQWHRTGSMTAEYTDFIILCKNPISLRCKPSFNTSHFGLRETEIVHVVFRYTKYR